jgi:hypothetical protein
MDGSKTSLHHDGEDLSFQTNLKFQLSDNVVVVVVVDLSGRLDSSGKHHEQVRITWWRQRRNQGL